MVTYRISLPLSQRAAEARQKKHSFLSATLINVDSGPQAMLMHMKSFSRGAVTSFLSTQMNDHSWSFMIFHDHSLSLSVSLSLSIAISESLALPAQAFLPSFRVQICPLILWRHPRMEWPRNTQVNDGEGLARHGVASSSASEPCQCKLLLDGSNGPIFYFMAQSSNSQSHKITRKPKKGHSSQDNDSNGWWHESCFNRQCCTMLHTMLHTLLHSLLKQLRNTKRVARASQVMMDRPRINENNPRSLLRLHSLS